MGHEVPGAGAFYVEVWVDPNVSAVSPLKAVVLGMWAVVLGVRSVYTTGPSHDPVVQHWCSPCSTPNVHRNSSGSVSRPNRRDPPMVALHAPVVSMMLPLNDKMALPK